ncbi:NAD(P)-binding protein [Xylona heveae TC161]|uniref:NAD(P)-binding protein n=1 Tax=Xylona heveae (strain CBS 132557 / TC161) TaxID=1328760 RepID=A0A165J7L6_XYLHT|nr:NAD(P)-binding protein [Xylona heveae TC161]KZF25853.1 NAD(P)-binding protein [Xylona heveae TC161]
MTASTIVLITGVSRGIGKTLAETYLLRPNHIVIGSVRDKTASNARSLAILPAAKGSRMHLIQIESTSSTDPANAVKELEAAGIDHIDVVIANAGGAGDKGIIPLDVVDVNAVTDLFKVNTIGPLMLYQAVRPLLEKSRVPKWVSVTSAAGSIGNLEIFKAHVAPAYGIAKAGLNWVTVYPRLNFSIDRAAHSANKWLIAFAVHPGLVQTDGGNRAAQAMGLQQAPHTMQQSATAIIGLIDNATREKTSSKFFNVIDGTEIPW